MSRRFVRMVPMLLVMGTIFFLSHQSGDDLHLPSFWGADKLAHFIAYSFLAVTTLFVHAEESKLHFPGRVCLNTVLVAAVYGLSDEFHQSFIPGRFVSVGDLLADTFGGLVVGGIFLFMRHPSKS